MSTRLGTHARCDETEAGVTQEDVKGWYDYNPETGQLSKIGYPGYTSTKTTNCYVRTRWRGKRWFVHRLVWMWWYGEWPDTIDHINGIKNDNRIENLESVTNEENIRRTTGCRYG